MTESSSNEQRKTDAADSGQGTDGTFTPRSGKGPHIVPVPSPLVGATPDSGKGPHINTLSLTQEPDSGKGPHVSTLDLTEEPDSGKGPHISTLGLTDEPDSGKGPHAPS